VKLETTALEIPIEVREDLPAKIPIQELCKGLKLWHNPVNKFAVARLHYSADPKKRTKQWRELAKAGLSYAQWMREYEIVWSSFEGKPVFLDSFSRNFHVSEDSLVWSMEHPVIRGWDFGLGAHGMACIWAQLLTHSRLFVYRELTSTDADITEFAEAVKRYSLEWFPGALRYFDIVDPYGFNRSNIDKRTCVGVIREKLKTHPIPGERSSVTRRKAVFDYLGGNVKGLPKIVISGPDANMLVEGFEGGYHYAFTKNGELKDEPEKNTYSNPHDALQYICSRVDRLDFDKADEVVVPATPKYGFGR
jgi:hypothetical protein